MNIGLMTAKNYAYYTSVTIDEIPWERIESWYGRSTQFPILFKNCYSINTEINEKSLIKIIDLMEHQDGIISITPFALIFILRLLDFEKINKIIILQHVLKIVQSCIYTEKTYFNHIDKKASRNYIKDCLSEEFLLPPFISEENDESIENADMLLGISYNSVFFTFDIINFYSPNLNSLQKSKDVELAQKILLLCHESFTRKQLENQNSL